ncbi:hypothetical protein [Nocardia bhagyanarayanae]|uniref:Uncharacterized protein n=1 Tax=Nocardia bhagyanarayanae TaxID=1215925 RepID=A0A543FG10_9NOCA|nr:hypothetical protein [Nocardia bhagyanarayanae]TQM32686.1 hypothetical protein FB390_4381 [Nocardia bhagyanarayanae]
MSDDPAGEASQAVRQGFIQGMQTAQMTAGMIRGFGADGRSRQAHRQAMDLAQSKEQRSIVEHMWRLVKLGDEIRANAELNTKRGDEIDERRAQNKAKARLERREIRARMGRGDKDLIRRDQESERKETRDKALHEPQLDLANARVRHEQELFELDRDIKTMRLEAAKRAAGFSDRLQSSQSPADTAAMRSAAAFAAADASEGLSQTHAGEAAAFRERFAEDTGRGFGDTEFAATSPTFTTTATGRAAREWYQAVDLAAALTVTRHFEHFFGDPEFDEELGRPSGSDPEPAPGAATGAAIASAGLTRTDATEAETEPIVIDVEPLSVLDVPLTRAELEP